MNKVQKYIPLFAYGILRYPSSIMADGGINIVENAKVKGYKLYAQGGIGIALTEFTGDHDDFVYGTYFEIPEPILLNEYDFIEGYDSTNVDTEMNMYNRKKVDVELPNGETKQADMYLANVSWFHKSFIPEFNIPSGRHEDKYLLPLNKKVTP